MFRLKRESVFMGFVDSLKGFYFSMEDRYYALLDSIDEHLPVYNIVDPIDKVFPSFILFCAIVLVLLGAPLFLLPQYFLFLRVSE